MKKLLYKNEANKCGKQLLASLISWIAMIICLISIAILFSDLTLLVAVMLGMVLLTAVMLLKEVKYVESYLSNLLHTLNLIDIIINDIY